VADQTNQRLYESAPDDHLIAALGFTPREVEGCDWAIEMPITDRIINANGVVQGGVIATMIDVVGGMALFAVDDPYDQSATMDMHVTYHAGARVGPVLGTAYVLRRGGSSASVRVELYDEGAANVHVATGMLTFAARRLPADDQRNVRQRGSFAPSPDA
jgi:uncharacterized protein (TIGR00369 family)